MKYIKIKLNKKYLWIVPAVLVILTALTIASYWPSTREDMKRSIAVIEYRSYYRITTDNKDTLFFDVLDSDTTVNIMSADPTDFKDIRYATGCWINKYAIIPSCFGRLLMAGDDGNVDSTKKVVITNLRSILAKEKKETTKDVKALKGEADDLNYYERVHGVQDEGYDNISQYATKTNTKLKIAEKTLDIISNFDSDAIARIDYIPEYKVIYRDNDNTLRTEHCHQITDKSKSGFRLIQTDSESTPSYAHPQHFHHIWTWLDRKGKTIFAASYPGINDGSFEATKNKSDIVAGQLKDFLGKQAPHTINSSFAPDGSPVFSKYGFFLGVSFHGEVINTRQFYFLFIRLK